MSPLITHRIGVHTCLQRQRTHYHKCHRCVYRGKAVDFEPTTSPIRLRPLAPAAVQRNGLPAAAASEPVPAKPKSGGKTRRSAKPEKAARPES